MAGEAAVPSGTGGGTGAANSAPNTNANGGDAGAEGTSKSTQAAPGVQRRTPVVEHKGGSGKAEADAIKGNAGKTDVPQGKDAAPEKPADEPAFPRKLKHTINGKLYEHTVNSWDELQDVTQRWNAEAMRTRQFQSEAERQRQILERAKRDPRARAELLKQIGYDPRADVVQTLQEEFALEQMDPKDRELHQTKKELERLQKMEEQRQQAEEQRRQQEIDARMEAEVEQDILSALDELKDYMDDETRPEVALYVIDVMREAADRGETLTAKQVAARVRRIEDSRSNKVRSRLTEPFKALKGKELLDHLNGYDPGLVERILSAHLEQNAPREVPLTTAQKPTGQPAPTTVRGDDDERSETMGVRYGAAPRLGWT